MYSIFRTSTVRVVSLSNSAVSLLTHQSLSVPLSSTSFVKLYTTTTTTTPVSFLYSTTRSLAFPTTTTKSTIRTNRRRRISSTKTMTKKFYAVAIGRAAGVYETWYEAEKQVKGFSGAKFKSFKNKVDADIFVSNQKNIQKVDEYGNNHTNTNDDTTTTNEIVMKKRCVPDDSETDPKKVSSKKRIQTTTRSHDDDITNQESQQQQTSNVNQHEPVLRNVLKIHINFDGGSRGNPGLAGAGASITVNEITKSTTTNKSTTDGNYNRVIHIREYLGKHYTNNEAEYQGIVRSLLVAKNIVTKLCSSYNNNNNNNQQHQMEMKLIIQGDSDLIIKQLNKEYKVRNANLLKSYVKVVDMIKVFNTLGKCHTVYEHVYREYNKVADALANEAMDAQSSWITTSDDDHQTRHSLDSF